MFPHTKLEKFIIQKTCFRIKLETMERTISDYQIICFKHFLLLFKEVYFHSFGTNFTICQHLS